MSSTEVPAPKSRGRHRANKSTPHANFITSSKPHSHITQQPPRTVKDVVTPPQSPKAQQQSPHNVSTKKNKRKQKPRLRDVNTDVHHNAYQGYDSLATSSNDELNASPPSPTRGAAVLTTPTKAYAGPNFHSSPNPSSLPVPSWFSKSVPATPSAGSSLQAMLDLSGDSRIQSLEEPESHLQKLFRADKEEKAKRATAMAAMPTLATLAQASPETPRRKSPDSFDSSFTDVFAMDSEKTTPSEIRPQASFHGPTQTPKVLTNVEARRRADALKSFLNQPPLSPFGVEKVVERPANQSATPFTPAKRRSSPPQHGNYSAPHSQLQTPAKKTSPQQTCHSDRNPHFIMTPPKGPKRHQSGQHPQTPTPARDYNHPRYPSRNETQNDSVLQLTEMELYLRRVLNLENRAIATPAAAS